MTPNDVKIVADNIDDFIEVPDGIVRLRIAVLVLAISGKLVPQDPNDGVAEDLYHKIQEERSWKDRISRKTKEPENIIHKKKLFEIPKSWRWIQIGDLFRVDNGFAFKSSDYTDSGARVIRISNVQDGVILDSSPKFISVKKMSEYRNYTLEEDDLLMSLTGNVGRVGLISKEMLPALLNQRVARLVPWSESVKPFLYTYFRSSFFQHEAQKGSRGMAQANMSTEWLKEHYIPLPPLSEQKRIVKKVEELMKQLDVLEEMKRERDEVRTRLARSAMQSLGKCDSKVAFEQLTELIKTPADIKELEGALLTLAVSGKLVPQDRKEGTGEELYAQIRSEIEASRQKKNNQKTHHTIQIELPFVIPKSWGKAELGKITYQITDGTHFTPTYIEKGVPFVSIKDVSGGKLDFSNTKYISEKEHSELAKRCNPQFDDILFCRIGTLGRAALVDTRNPFSIFVSLGLIKYPTSKILPKYLLTVLNSPCLYAQYDEIKAGGSHTNKLNLKEMPRLIIPLPPFAEQKRIVKKVEEVMELVNQLRDILGESKASGRGRPKK